MSCVGLRGVTSVQLSRDFHSGLKRGAGWVLVFESAVWCREDGPQPRSTTNGGAAISKPSRLAGAAEVLLQAEDAGGPSVATSHGQVRTSQVEWGRQAYR